jgi:hypothetical protein
VAVTLENLRLVSQPSTTWSIWILLAVIVGYLLVSGRFARPPRTRLTVFVTGCLAIFGVTCWPTVFDLPHCGRSVHAGDGT